MPAKSGKDGNALKNKYENYVGRMTGPRTKAAMAKVLSIGMTGAKELAPIEYSTLINSSFRRIEGSRLNWRGIAGFTVNYAVYLHEKTNWKPRPPDKKAGPAWNANATPKFLARGFTDPEQLSMIQTVIKSEYKS
ncbi:hypothetical protein VPKG_00031 [Vibrio phage pYD21-A]|uniref:hypothetical protein n=1 Tax=Vibrio phage pYD21-A TaxID=754049 RepID=UPI0002C0CC0B|nr:hypothetical protein VPKG_00031 [Vibrio phage pYD21-A]AGH16068.1 hypothetical protein VPKG_00031 [Vibrio phage pYD21-A]